MGGVEQQLASHTKAGCVGPSSSWSDYGGMDLGGEIHETISLHDGVAARVKMGNVRCLCLRWRWPLPGQCGCEVHEEMEETPPLSDWVALQWDWSGILKWVEQGLVCHNSMMILPVPISAYDFQCMHDAQSVQTFNARLVAHGGAKAVDNSENADCEYTFTRIIFQLSLPYPDGSATLRSHWVWGGSSHPLKIQVLQLDGL